MHIFVLTSMTDVIDIAMWEDHFKMHMTIRGERKVNNRLFAEYSSCQEAEKKDESSSQI